MNVRQTQSRAITHRAVPGSTEPRRARRWLPLERSTAPGGFGNPAQCWCGFGSESPNHVFYQEPRGFGQATFDVTDRLSVSGGLRYTRDQAVDVKRFAASVE